MMAACAVATPVGCGTFRTELRCQRKRSAAVRTCSRERCRAFSQNFAALSLRCDISDISSATLEANERIRHNRPEARPWIVDRLVRRGHRNGLLAVLARRPTCGERGPHRSTAAQRTTLPPADLRSSSLLPIALDAMPAKRPVGPLASGGVLYTTKRSSRSGPNCHDQQPSNDSANADRNQRQCDMYQQILDRAPAPGHQFAPHVRRSIALGRPPRLRYAA